MISWSSFNCAQIYLSKISKYPNTGKNCAPHTPFHPAKPTTQSPTVHHTWSFMPMASWPPTAAGLTTTAGDSPSRVLLVGHIPRKKRQRLVWVWPVWYVPPILWTLLGESWASVGETYSEATFARFLPINRAIVTSLCPHLCRRR